MNIPIRTDPDFKPKRERIIDLRPFFDKPNTKEQEEDNKEETFDIQEPLLNYEGERETFSSSELIISPAIRAEKQRETMLEMEREERKAQRPLRYIALDIFLALLKAILVFLIERYQTLERTLRPFETKHTEKQLYYLWISLPGTIRTANDILLYYPLMSRAQRYKLLRIRRDTLRMFQKIYEKK